MKNKKIIYIFLTIIAIVWISFFTIFKIFFQNSEEKIITKNENNQTINSWKLENKKEEKINKIPENYFLRKNQKLKDEENFYEDLKKFLEIKIKEKNNTEFNYYKNCLYNNICYKNTDYKKLKEKLLDFTNNERIKFSNKIIEDKKEITKIKILLRNNSKQIFENFLNLEDNHKIFLEKQKNIDEILNSEKNLKQNLLNDFDFKIWNILTFQRHSEKEILFLIQNKEEEKAIEILNKNFKFYNKILEWDISTMNLLTIYWAYWLNLDITKIILNNFNISENSKKLLKENLITEVNSKEIFKNSLILEHNLWILDIEKLPEEKWLNKKETIEILEEIRYNLIENNFKLPKNLEEKYNKEPSFFDSNKIWKKIISENTYSLENSFKKIKEIEEKRKKILEILKNLEN